MTGLQHPGRRMLRLFPGLSNRRPSDRVNSKAHPAVVRPVDAPCRPPATPIEQRLMTLLKKRESVSFAQLVEAVAIDLYREELRMGAGVLNIGLFGSRLFEGDVIRELWTGNGILWEIEKEEQMAR